MEEELKELKNIIKIKDEKKIYDYTFYIANINQNKIILVESGVGKVNSARCTQILIDHLKPDYIINIGVAGSINPNVSIGDIVIAEKLVQYDFDITAFNHKKGYIPKVGDDISSNRFLLNLALSTPIKSKIHKGIIATGDTFLTDQIQEQEVATTHQALCAEMEGASIAQVCFLSDIPFIVIRSISDSSNQGNVLYDYETFLEKSCQIVAKYIKKIIERI